MRLEMIEWADHNSYAQNVWRDKASFDDSAPLKIMTTGWVIKETKDVVTLVSTQSESDRYTGDMTILKKGILNRWTLTDPGKRIREGKGKTRAGSTSKTSNRR